jgi:transposase-like protein
MEESTLALEKEEIGATPGSAAKLIREEKRQTHKKFFAEDKIRIVLEGFRKEIPVSDLCRRENISTAIYYSWLKVFMEAGKVGLKEAVKFKTSYRCSLIQAMVDFPNHTVRRNI